MEYYIYKDDKQTGPFTFGQLRSMWASGSITADTLYWHEGSSDWLSMRVLSAKLEQMGSSSAPASAKRSYPAPAHAGIPMRRIVGSGAPVSVRTARSRGIYIILGLFFGLLGIHNFYAGYYRNGVWQLVLNLLLFWTIIVPIGIAIWVIFELCTIIEDADGQPLA